MNTGEADGVGRDLLCHRDHQQTLNGGTIERAAAIAGHASARTTQLYDRRSDEVSLDEVELILI
jgi:hypothetical protein